MIWNLTHMDLFISLNNFLLSQKDIELIFYDYVK